MDEQSKAIFKQFLTRLEKIDNQQQKLDRVMERLDTLQNILERQNQRQNSLDKKLAEITVKLEQKTAVTTEQLQAEQREIAETIRVIDSQGRSSLLQDKTTQQLQDWGKNINDKLQSIVDQTVDTAEKYQHLTSLSSNIEDRVTELVDNKAETMKTFLLEIRSVKDLIKGQTNSELIFLNNQLEKKLSEIDSVVRDIYQQQKETQKETVRSVGQVVETVIHRGEQQGARHEPVAATISDKQTKAILDLERKMQQLHSSVLEVPKEIKTSLDSILERYTRFITDLEKTITDSISEMNKKEQTLSVSKSVHSDLSKLFDTVQKEIQTNRLLIIKDSETQTSKIISAAEAAKADLKRLIQTERDDTSKYKMLIGNIHALTHFLVMDTKENTATVVKRIDKNNEEMKKEHTVSNRKLQEVTADLKVNMNEMKREISAVTEKEAMLVRNQMQGLMKSEEMYPFLGGTIALLLAWFLYRWIFA